MGLYPIKKKKGHIDDILENLDWPKRVEIERPLPPVNPDDPNRVARCTGLKKELEIVWDKFVPTIGLGGPEALFPSKASASKNQWKHTVLRALNAVGVQTPEYKHPKQWAQDMAELIGVSPKVYYKHYCARVIEYWYGKKGSEKQSIALKLCMTKLGFSDFHKMTFRVLYPEIKKCFDEGQANLAPFVLWFNMPVDVIKDRFNDDEWERIKSNTLSRNHLVAEAIWEIGLSVDLALKMPTHWLKHPSIWKHNFSSGHVSPETLEKLIEISKEVKIVSKQNHHANIVRVFITENTLLREEYDTWDIEYIRWFVKKNKSMFCDKDKIYIGGKSVEQYKIFLRGKKLAMISSS
jgi:hypothetical protein